MLPKPSAGNTKVTESASFSGLEQKAFQKCIDGRQVDLYTIRNERGLLARLTNHGARLVQLLVPDRSETIGDVVLGYDSIDQTLTGQVAAGASIGRFANRIRNARFSLDGTTWKLSANENAVNHLHGGTKGSRLVVFDGHQIDYRSVEFSYLFKDGEEGYPGNCWLKVVYCLTEDNELKISYEASTDAPTVVNFTNHTFWNLAGHGEGTIRDHVLTIDADVYAPNDNKMVVTGELLKVEGTPLDFRKPTPIGERIDDDFEQLNFGPGYSTNYVLNKPAGAMGFALSVYEPATGRMMEVYTTEPAVLLVTANQMTGKPPRDVGKGGTPYVRQGFFAVETQHLPDSPNIPWFPTTTLNPGETFTSCTVHRLSVR